jgi:hypothetical protein
VLLEVRGVATGVPESMLRAKTPYVCCAHPGTCLPHISGAESLTERATLARAPNVFDDHLASCSCTVLDAYAGQGCPSAGTREAVRGPNPGPRSAGCAKVVRLHFISQRRRGYLVSSTVRHHQARWDVL